MSHVQHVCVCERGEMPHVFCTDLDPRVVRERFEISLSDAGDVGETAARVATVTMKLA